MAWFAATEAHCEDCDLLFKVPVLDEATGLVNKNMSKCITRTAVSNVLKATAVELGIPKGDIATHSLRIGGATALLHSGADPNAIQIIGRWASDIWKIYTRFSRNLMTGVATDMAEVQVSQPNTRAPTQSNQLGKQTAQQQ